MREYKQNWEEIQKELQEHDVLKLSSLLELGENEEQLKERLEYCEKKDIVLRIQTSSLESDVYMDILKILLRSDAQKKQQLYDAQQKGIQKALEKKKSGKGAYGRPRVKLPKDFAEQVKEYIRNNQPLEHYRKQTRLKKSTFYKYVRMVKQDIQYL